MDFDTYRETFPDDITAPIVEEVSRSDIIIESMRDSIARGDRQEMMDAVIDGFAYTFRTIVGIDPRVLYHVDWTTSGFPDWAGSRIPEIIWNVICAVEVCV